MNYFDILFAQKMSGGGGGATKTYTITIHNSTSDHVAILIPCMGESKGEPFHDVRVFIRAGGTTTATVIADLTEGEEMSIGKLYKYNAGEFILSSNYDIVSSSGNTEYDEGDIYFYGDDEITITLGDSGSGDDKQE